MSSDTPAVLSVLLFGLVASGSAILSGIYDAGLRWYDRAVRVFGGGIIFLVLLIAIPLAF